MAPSHCLSKAAALEGLCCLHEKTMAGFSKYVSAEVSRYIFSAVGASRKPLARCDSVTCVNAEEVQLFQQCV